MNSSVWQAGTQPYKKRHAIASVLYSGFSAARQEALAPPPGAHPTPVRWSTTRQAPQVILKHSVWLRISNRIYPYG